MFFWGECDFNDTSGDSGNAVVSSFLHRSEIQALLVIVKKCIY